MQQKTTINTLQIVSTGKQTTTLKANPNLSNKRLRSNWEGSPADIPSSSRGDFTWPDSVVYLYIFSGIGETPVQLYILVLFVGVAVFLEGRIGLVRFGLAVALPVFAFFCLAVFLATSVCCAPGVLLDELKVHNMFKMLSPREHP